LKLIQSPTGKRIPQPKNVYGLISELANAVNSCSSSVAQKLIEESYDSIPVRNSLGIGERAKNKNRILKKTERQFRKSGIIPKRNKEELIPQLHDILFRHLKGISINIAFFYIARIFIACGMGKASNKNFAHSLYVSYKHLIEKNPAI